MDEFLYKNENTESFLKYSNYFHKVYMKILNKHAPCKKKYIKWNNRLLVNKGISKAIMFTAKLRKKLLKYPTTTNQISYSKQRSFCLSLLRKEKKNYFANLNVNYKTFS